MTASQHCLESLVGHELHGYLEAGAPAHLPSFSCTAPYSQLREYASNFLVDIQDLRHLGIYAPQLYRPGSLLLLLSKGQCALRTPWTWVELIALAMTVLVLLAATTPARIVAPDFVGLTSGRLPA